MAWAELESWQLIYLSHSLELVSNYEGHHQSNFVDEAGAQQPSGHPPPRNESDLVREWE